MSETGPEEFEEFSGAPESSGVEGVDQALTALQGLANRPVEEHPAVFEGVHDALRAVLSSDSRA